MPNGDPNFDVDAQEVWFSPIAHAITRFSDSRGLLLEKYYHDSPSWFLRFTHPRGGHASIQISNCDDRVGIISYWHFDDYEKFTRFLHWGDRYDVERSEPAVSTALATSFEYLVTREFGDWNQVVGNYENVWGRYSKSEFEAMAPSYPDPKLDSDA